MKNIPTLIVSLCIILFTLTSASVGHTNPDSVETIPLTDDILRSKAAFTVVDEEIARQLNLSALSEWDYRKLRGPVLWKIRAPIHFHLRKQFGRIVNTVDFSTSSGSGSPIQTPPMTWGEKPILHEKAAEIIRDFINQEQISVIIRSNAPIGIGEVAAIRGLRGEVRYTYDIINGACVFVPIRDLTALIKRPFVREVWLDSKGRAALKDSVPQIGADQVHNLIGGGSGVMGEGVHVAVVDSGIDPSHPEFQGRILDNRKVTIDMDHGTHVAGIIGSADGVAPKVKFLDARMSGITLLRFDDGFFNSNVGYSDTLDAIRWAAHKKLILNAEEKADVINMSWGWPIWIYGRKGDDLMSELIDEVVSDGIVFVVSAGNEAQKRAIGNIAPNSKPSPHTFTVYHSDDMGTIFPSITVTCVLLWDQEDNDLDLAILDANDEEVAESRSNPFFFFGKTYKEETEHGRKKYYELVELTSESPNGAAQKYRFRVEGADVRVAQKYEVWVDNDLAAFEIPNSEQTVSVPGYSEKAITVGAVDNSKQIASFSSQGPSDADLIKPEIVAPGYKIKSTLRTPALPGEQSGTSQAAPHVAGVAALILDAVGKNERGEWNFSPDDIKSTIVHGAEELSNKPNTYGAGLVRADKIIFGNPVEANKKIRFKIEPQPTGLNVDFALKVAISWENPAHNLDLVLLDANGKKLLESNQVSSNYEKIGGGNSQLLPSSGVEYFLEVLNRSQEPVTFTGAATHKIIETPILAQNQSPDLIVESLTMNKSTLSPGEDFTLSMIVKNQGSGQAPATTLRYYKWDETTEGWKQIPDETTFAIGSLSANSSNTKDVTFTAPNAVGAHFYSVCVDAVPGEANPDTNCSESWVTITVQQESVPEDVNSDGIVNILDLALVDSRFGETGENAADVNEDGIVNIADLLLVAKAMGEIAAAPSANAMTLDVLTIPQIQQWLTEARGLDNSLDYQRGISVLEQLLAALTPEETRLLANYPNPFNPETWIPYQLAEAAEVILTISAVDGTVIRTWVLGHQTTGTYQNRSRAVYWNGRNTLGEQVASGVYFYTLTAGDFTATRKMLITK